VVGLLFWEYKVFMRKLICSLLIVISPCSLAEVNAKTLDKLVFQWSQLEQQHSEIDNRWREEKPVVEQQLRLLKAEKKQLEKLLNEHADASSNVKSERIALLSEQTRMEQLQVTMQTDLLQITDVVLSMYNQLPPPIKAKWKKDILLLTVSNDKKTELLTNSERLEKLLTLLESIERFEERPALHQTTMQVKKSPSTNTSNNANNFIEIQVDQVYLGISQGWYLSKDGRYWGSGNSNKQGWQWQHQSDRVNVSDLKNTVKMLTEPATATIVTLPVTLSNSPTKQLPGNTSATSDLTNISTSENDSANGENNHE